MSIPRGLYGAARPRVTAPPAGMAAWWKADDLALTNNDPVASWVDSSGNSNTAEQATSGYRPVYKTNIRNGLPVVEFAGTHTAKHHLTTPASASTAAVTLCMALSHGSYYENASTPLGSTLNGEPTGGSGGWQVDLHSTGGSRLLRQYVALVGQSGSGLSYGWYYLTYRYGAGSWTVRVNGSATSGSASHTPTADRQYTIGRNGATTLEATGQNWWFGGYLGEILTYSTALSDPDVTAAESYLSTKWGI